MSDSNDEKPALLAALPAGNAEWLADVKARGDVLVIVPGLDEKEGKR